jgi:hypothetical protein
MPVAEYWIEFGLPMAFCALSSTDLGVDAQPVATRQTATVSHNFLLVFIGEPPSLVLTFHHQ